MKAKEIIKNVCIYLGKDEILSSSIFEENGEDVSGMDYLTVSRMLNALNLITEEIASDYLPIIKEKTIELVNGEIDVKQIDENFLEIVGIKNKFGKSLRYRYVNGKIVCLASTVTITYKVYPNKITLDGDAEDFGGRLSARVIAYGVASEYCYLEMLYDDASIWESRFKNSLLIACRKKGELMLKKRGWR